MYCSDACRTSAEALGHDLICAQAHELNAWCSEFGRNFPRTAAAMLARSFSPSEDFSTYWGRVNALAAIPIPGDPDALPREWHVSYGLVRSTLLRSMGGAGADTFFSVAFDLRTYARLHGTLRLNSFTMACPLPDVPSTVESSRSPTVGPLGARLPAPDGIAPAPAPTPCNSTAPVAADSAAAGGCCSGGDDAGGGGGGCGPGSGASSADVGHHGTALYGAASLVNHSCDPSLDVVIGPQGLLQLRGVLEGW